MEVSALKAPAAPGLRSPSALLRLQSDERLIALIRRGQHAAFETLFSRYQSRLLAFCRHMLGSKEDAEDVLQEVFAAAFNAILADEREINVRPWLYRIARNRSLNHLRKASAIGVDSMDVHFADNGVSTADKVMRRESFRQLIGDVQELPETQRTALLLREIDALSYEQISDAMETTVPAVKSLLVRARISLAEAAEARKLSCDEARLELGEVAEGLVKSSPAVRRHVRDCERCRAFRKQLKDNNVALAAIMPVGATADAQEACAHKAGVNRRRRGGPCGWRRRSRRRCRRRGGCRRSKRNRQLRHGRRRCFGDQGSGWTGGRGDRDGRHGGGRPQHHHSPAPPSRTCRRSRASRCACEPTGHHPLERSAGDSLLLCHARPPRRRSGTAPFAQEAEDPERRRPYDCCSGGSRFDGCHTDHRAYDRAQAGAAGDRGDDRLDPAAKRPGAQHHHRSRHTDRNNCHDAAHEHRRNRDHTATGYDHSDDAHIPARRRRSRQRCDDSERRGQCPSAGHADPAGHAFHRRHRRIVRAPRLTHSARSGQRAPASAVCFAHKRAGTQRSSIYGIADRPARLSGRPSRLSRCGGSQCGPLRP